MVAEATHLVEMAGLKDFKMPTLILETSMIFSVNFLVEERVLRHEEEVTYL